MANEVAKKKSSNVVAFDESILLEDVGAGQENMTKDDMMIPRITILQQMSPQTMKREGDYVEGAEAGHIFDNVAQRASLLCLAVIVVPTLNGKLTEVAWSGIMVLTQLA